MRYARATEPCRLRPLRILLALLLVMVAPLHGTASPAVLSAASSAPSPAPQLLFSHPAGIYETGFDLSITTADEASSIYYTTDGSIPSVASNPATRRYTGPIPVREEFSAPVYGRSVDVPRQFNPEYRLPAEIRKATVIRAMYVDAFGHPGETVTASYMVGLFADAGPRLGVVSLTGSPEELFDFETGMYNDTDPDETQAIVNVEYFDKTGERIFSYDAQTRVFGGFTRNFAQRSLILDFEEGAVRDRIRYPLFGEDSRDIYGKRVESFDRLRLHTGGNDSKLTTFLDGMIMNLSRDMALGTNPYVPVIAFLNGEYWGLYALREDFKSDYFEKHYHVPGEDVIAVKIVWGDDNVPAVTMGEPSDLRYYEEMYAFLENQDFQSDVVYRHFIDYYMDEDSFMDFYIANLYVNNIDWPGNNVRMWRSRTIQTDRSPVADGRWRFILHDPDAGFKDMSKEMLPILLKKGVNAILSPGPPFDDWATLPFRQMARNPAFVEKFTNRMLMHLNTTYEKTRVLDAIDAYSGEKQDFVAEHKARWGQTNAFPYEQMVAQLRAFAYTRTERMLGLMNQYLGTGGVEKVEIVGLREKERLELHFGEETATIAGDGEDRVIYAYRARPLVIAGTSETIKGYIVREDGKYRYVRGNRIALEVAHEDLSIIPVRFNLRDSLGSPEGIILLVLTVLFLGAIVMGRLRQKRGRRMVW
jgi:hypothetical protein